MDYTLKDIIDAAEDSVELGSRLQQKKRVVTLGCCGDIGTCIQDALNFATNSVLKQQKGFILCDGNKTKARYLQYPPVGVYKPKKKQTQSLPIIVTVMKEIESNIKNDVVATFRDIYYRNTDLYGCQQNVVDSVTTIQKLFHLTSNFDLNVIAAQKGLIYTPVSINIIDYNNKSQQISRNKSELIPHCNYDKCKMHIEGNEELSILVLEKEAVYNTIIQDPPLNTIIVTGKGYPDRLSRSFLKSVICHNPKIRIRILTDPDPYGVNIALKYIQSVHTAVRKGVSIVELVNKDQVLRLNLRAIRICQGLLNKEIPLDMRLELQRQLFFMKKGEMNSNIDSKTITKYLL